MSYALLDSGFGQKLERFGPVTLIRPCAPAIWSPKLEEEVWKQADAEFSRDGGNKWDFYREIPETWEIEIEGIRFIAKLTDFGHTGVFPEHAAFWKWIEAHSSEAKVLNLFAYSGGATLAAAKGGGQVTHLDAAKGMVSWASDNAELNELKEAPIRWIVDDVRKYLARALRRGEKYDAIILDPPSYGKGKGKELFKIEEDLPEVLDQCVELLSDKPRYLLLSCHTTGFTPLVLEQLIKERIEGGKVDAGEMCLKAAFSVPSGAYAQWTI